MKNIIVCLMVLMLSGCALVTTDRITTADTQGRFHMGMDFNEVAAIVGRQPSSFSDDYEVETAADGIYKRWVVEGKCDGSGPSLYRYYEFKFKDNKLVSWGWHK